MVEENNTELLSKVHELQDKLEEERHKESTFQQEIADIRIELTDLLQKNQEVLIKFGKVSEGNQHLQQILKTLRKRNNYLEKEIVTVIKARNQLKEEFNNLSFQLKEMSTSYTCLLDDSMREEKIYKDYTYQSWKKTKRLEEQIETISNENAQLQQGLCLARQQVRQGAIKQRSFDIVYEHATVPFFAYDSLKLRFILSK